MAYEFQPDEIRQEVRRSVAGTVLFFPKITGTGAVTASSATFSVLDSSGVEIQASTSASISGTTVTCAIPAISNLGEDYQVSISWVYSGVTYSALVQFDVVMYPYGALQIDLSALQEERPDIGEVLDRLGDHIGKTQEQMASIFAYRARVELDRLVRDAIPTGDFGRPHLILNQERLARVERKLALKLIYASEMRNPEGEDESAGMYRFYAGEADTAWRSAGPLKFADPGATTPIVAEEKISPGRVRYLRRG